MNSVGCYGFEGENATLEEIDQFIEQRAASAGPQRSRRRPCVQEATETPPKPLDWKCNKCPKAFETAIGLHNHKRVHSSAKLSPVRRPSTPTIDLTGGTPEPEKDLGTSGTSARIVETPGELAILKCVVEGNPAPKFAWKKGGREVPLTDDRVRCQMDGDTRTRKAKAPFNVPGPPGPPKPLHTAYNSIMLLWAQPLRDGGTPITGYDLEKREHGTNAQWEKAAFGSVPDTQFKVTGVKQYHFYEFRVAAVNAVGQGEWSDNSVPIAATRSSCKPLITKGMLACDMTVLVGEPAKLLVPYAANPPPTITWKKNGEAMDVRADPRAEVEISDILIQLCYQKCEQSDTGNYSIRIVNDFGSDSVDLRLEVVDRPAPPEGSLKERTTSGSGRRRVGSTAAARQAQAAAAACAADEEAPNEEGRQDVAVVTKKMAILALRRANDEHETESSAVDEDEYVVESDDDIPAVEHRSSVDMRRESLAEILDLGTSGTPARIGASLFPGKREERWVDPLPEKLQFQQQKNKIAELKCKYSRANAKVHWYKGRKELFSDCLKYKILIDKQSITLIINNPDPDDSGKYSCEANGVPTNSFITVEDSTDQQPLSYTARRSESRRPKSARKEAAALTPLDAMQCCSSHLTPPHPKNTNLGTFGTSAPDQPLSSTARRHEPRRPIDMAAVEVRCADEPLLANAPFNVPGRPYPPDSLYTTYNSIMLHWAPPLRDGGTPITEYELEKREHGTKLWEKADTNADPKANTKKQWEKDAFANVPDTRFKVTGVKPQHTYEFRVAAVNVAGRGEWSKNSVPIAATWFPCKPLITMGPLACDMTVLVGEQAKLLVPYAANSSRPKFVWSKNGKPMDPRDDPRVKEEKSDILIQLCYQKCEQSDTGTYSIRIVNDLGSDSVDLRLKVVDRPAPPEGSLKERTASSSGRRRVGSTAADRSAQAAAAACAADEEATDEVERQNMAAVTKRMANLTAQSEDERRVRTASGGGRRRCDDSGAAADRSAAQAAAAACALKAKLKKRDDTSIRALKRRSVRPEPSTSLEKEFAVLLELCGQQPADVLSWHDFEGSAGYFADWTKIGEGAFGEVFTGLLDGASIVLKIMPFAVNEEQSSKLINGDNLKSAKFMFNELFITKALAKLSENTGNGVTPTFTQLLLSKIVRGCFPPELLDTWEAFKDAKPKLAENERPDTYADEGLHFMIIGLSHGGKDLEAYTIKNGRECYSIFHQIALSIAIAEDVLKLEHRDLHAGNILVEECSVDEKIRYKYLGKQIAVRSNGVRASIIDYSISRIEKKGVVFFADLSEETGLFEQNGVSKGGDYQYDVYRMMKAAVNENWAKFWPQTNVLWMGYAAKKLFNNRFIRAKRKEAIENLFSNFEKKFGSIRDFIDHPDFLSVFAEFTSGK